MDEKLRAHAQLLMEAGRIEEAIEQIERVIASTDDLAEKALATINKSSYYSAQGRLAKARAELSKAIQLAPTDPLTLLMHDFGEACLYGHEGHDAESYDKLTELFSLHPEFPKEPRLRYLYEDIQHLRGIALSRLGRVEEAIPLLKESLSFDLHSGQRSNTLCHLARCHVANQDYELAYDSFDSAIKEGLLSYWAAAAHFYLGICHFHLGRLAESKKELLLCEQVGGGPGVPLTNVYGWLSAVCAGLGEKSESEKYRRLAKPT